MTSELETARAVADEWRAKAEKLLALVRQLEADLGEARVGRENWKEVARKTEQERDSNDRVVNGALRHVLRALLDETHPAMRDIAIRDARALLAKVEGP